MRISDWSSDVCSSDLDAVLRRVEEPSLPRARAPARSAVEIHDGLPVGVSALLPVHPLTVPGQQHPRLVRLDLGVQDVVEVRGSVHSCAPALEKVSPAAAPSSWPRSEEHTSELQSLMRIPYAVF